MQVFAPADANLTRTVVLGTNAVGRSRRGVGARQRRGLGSTAQATPMCDAVARVERRCDEGDRRTTARAPGSGLCLSGDVAADPLARGASCEAGFAYSRPSQERSLRGVRSRCRNGSSSTRSSPRTASDFSSAWRVERRLRDEPGPRHAQAGDTRRAPAASPAAKTSRDRGLRARSPSAGRHRDGHSRRRAGGDGHRAAPRERRGLDSRSKGSSITSWRRPSPARRSFATASRTATAPSMWPGSGASYQPGSPPWSGSPRASRHS